MKENRIIKYVTGRNLSFLFIVLPFIQTDNLLFCALYKKNFIRLPVYDWFTDYTIIF
jgi:hypothetical protein